MKLAADTGLIFRITHIANMPWILDHGLCCPSGDCLDPGFRSIGSRDLIHKRRNRLVPIAPGGELCDYIPFYFTPWSPMLYNIKTGFNGIERHEMDDIAFLVTSIQRLAEQGHAFVVSDRHAYLQAAQFANDLRGLESIDWDLLSRRDFKIDPEDPGKLERYQAEALVHSHLPVGDLMGIACYSKIQEEALRSELADRDLALTIRVRREWYFV